MNRVSPLPSTASQNLNFSQDSADTEDRSYHVGDSGSEIFHSCTLQVVSQASTQVRLQVRLQVRRQLNRHLRHLQLLHGHSALHLILHKHRRKYQSSEVSNKIMPEQCLFSREHFKRLSFRSAIKP